jgi:hypothetical protein
MVSDTYTHNLEDLCEKVLEGEVNERFGEMKSAARGIFEEVCGIPRDNVLIVYGEQMDPPIVKNLGKAFLSSIIERKICSLGVEAKSVYLGLENDIFGSNAEVFVGLGLLHEGQAKQLGKQTYAFAPVTQDYVDNLVGIIEKDHPFRFRELGDYDITKQRIRELGGKEKTIGSFNYALRSLLGRGLGFCRDGFSLSLLEDKAMRDKEIRDLFLPFSKREREAPARAYVSWDAGGNRDRRLDTGIRRYEVLFGEEDVCVRNPYRNEIVFKKSFEDLLEDERACFLSFDAWSRAAFLYSVAGSGVSVTGGGSVYNERLVDYWDRQGLPRPLLTHISSRGFTEQSKRLAIDLPGKAKEICGVLEDLEKIKTTSDPVFSYFASWRSP